MYVCMYLMLSCDRETSPSSTADMSDCDEPVECSVSDEGEQDNGGKTSESFLLRIAADSDDEDGTAVVAFKIKPRQSKDLLSMLTSKPFVKLKSKLMTSSFPSDSKSGFIFSIVNKRSMNESFERITAACWLLDLGESE